MKSILATGSMPDETGKATLVARGTNALPGLANGKVFSCEEVFRDQAELGKAVIVLDEGGNWRGTGTAWYLADKGHDVTIVTPDRWSARSWRAPPRIFRFAIQPDKARRQLFAGDDNHTMARRPRRIALAARRLDLDA